MEHFYIHLYMEPMNDSFNWKKQDLHRNKREYICFQADIFQQGVWGDLAIVYVIWVTEFMFVPLLETKNFFCYFLQSYAEKR